MIELGRSRDELLAQIDASADLFSRPETDPRSPELASLEEAHFEITAHTRDEILPLVRAILLRRFDWVSEGRLFHELLLPLKRGLGNAFKRGNAADPDKWIRAHVAVTRSGAFVEIRNEGEGFDVEAVLDRFHRQERYFAHGGAGFETLERSTALVSYADAGRTLRISYRCPSRDDLDRSYSDADDERFMRDALQASLPMLKRHRGELESLRIRESSLAQSPQRKELAYELRYQHQESGEYVELSLTGRVLNPEAAQTDYAVARALAQGPFRRSRGVRIPEAFSAFKSQPCVVFYLLGDVVCLRDWIPRVSSDEALYACARIAEGIRTWHRCGLKPVRQQSLAERLAQRELGLADTAPRLDALQGGSAARLRGVGRRLKERLARLPACEPLPVHGRFGWDCIFQDGSELLFYEFEHACAAHPALDLGGFLADLRFRRSELGAAFVDAAEQRFLEGYGAVPWVSELGAFTTLAALDRIEEGIDAWDRDVLLRWVEVAEEGLADARPGAGTEAPAS